MTLYECTRRLCAAGIPRTLAAPSQGREQLARLTLLLHPSVAGLFAACCSSPAGDGRGLRWPVSGGPVPHIPCDLPATILVTRRAVGPSHPLRVIAAVASVYGQHHSPGLRVDSRPLSSAHCACPRLPPARLLRLPPARFHLRPVVRPLLHASSRR